MIIWILLLALFLTCIYMINAMRYSWSIMWVVPILILGLFFSMTAPAINQPHQHIPENYNIPYCPQNNISYYEQQEYFLSNETDIVNEFHFKGWTNITVFDRTSGGLFGGTDTFVSGKCNI